MSEEQYALIKKALEFGLTTAKAVQWWDAQHAIEIGIETLDTVRGHEVDRGR
jgi:hypothetical protein